MPYEAADLEQLDQQLAALWAQRREVRRDGVWDLPFPWPEPATARVIRVPADEAGGAVAWRAALVRSGARTACIEVEKRGGPLDALRSLYEHVA